MIIKSEISLEKFRAWSGGRNTLDRIINEGKCSQLESMLEDLYPDGMTDTELNDLLWFDSDTVFEWLDIRTYDQIKEELGEKKAELDSLLEEYHGYETDEDRTKEELEAIWEEDFKNSVETLKEEIAELEEELEDAA
ncbi:MAG: hypothetical protein HFG28_09545 [Eubacterium sp.]|nr:hypothetical protein [Eubacterium sp.]